MLGRDMNLLCAVNDMVFNQNDFRIYKITGMVGNTFTCEDEVTQEIKEFDITKTTLTKILRS